MSSITRSGSSNFNVDNLIHPARKPFHSLISVDPHIMPMLNDDCEELQINWRDAFGVIYNDPSFNSCCVDIENDVGKNVLMCVPSGDMFRLVLGKFEKARVLSRDAFEGNTGESRRTRVAEVVTAFVDKLLCWICLDCDGGM